VRTSNIAREDILALRGYNAGEQQPDTIRLNANEAPQSHWFDGDTLAMNRYPEVHPVSLQNKMAALFGVPANNLLVTRGSSEAIDVLIRAYCRAYRDSLITSPPTFEMYRFYADVQGIEMIDVPLLRDNDFTFDTNAILTASRPDTKLVFICSPNNPTGSMVSTDDILRIVEDRRDKSIVVVDEAYIEFSDRDSLASQVSNYENLVVLRTLSKAQALAGARCGAAIANEAIVDVMCRVLPPYSFPTPVIDCVLRALSGEQIETSRQFIADTVSERERLAERLGKLKIIETIWTSHANFLLARIDDLAGVQDYLHSKRILIRDFGDQPDLANCARITIGSREENTALLAALSAYEENT
jgi:histidinol-phosphate aminotransferase